ncbi:MAG: fumarylacetoacetate hydrolase [Candidatus Marinimicrobia bacterium]|nr:fumarylacetoacetate hydrolase [Candidatus Neomarinimicrobiota bacterium]
MKIARYKYKDNVSFGHYAGSEKIIDLGSNFNNILDLLDNIKKVDAYLKSENLLILDINSVELLPPLKPRSLRDAYAFRQHVETSRKNRGLEMIKEFDDFPVYYYSNADAVMGPGNINIDNVFMNKLDFELEVAILIGKEGINIDCKEADSYIAGFMIMNDFSARDLQMAEMKLNLGPAKGKDFATTIGPFLVTPDELKNHIMSTESGNKLSLKMECFINSKKLSEDNLKNLSWTFSQIIERVSMGTRIFPGDVIGSGTCATGCFLELNQTKGTQWLKKEDIIELKVESLGTLKNTIK